MSSIVSNQRAVDHGVGMDAGRAFSRALGHMSEPARASMLALLAAASSTPVDVVLMGEPGDEQECAQILDGVLARGDSPYSWKIGSGCCFVVVLPQGDDHHG